MYVTNKIRTWLRCLLRYLLSDTHNNKNNNIIIKKNNNKEIHVKMPTSLVQGITWEE